MAMRRLDLLFLYLTISLLWLSVPMAEGECNDPFDLSNADFSDMKQNFPCTFTTFKNWDDFLTQVRDLCDEWGERFGNLIASGLIDDCQEDWDSDRVTLLKKTAPVEFILYLNQEWVGYCGDDCEVAAQALGVPKTALCYECKLVQEKRRREMRKRAANS